MSIFAGYDQAYGTYRPDQKQPQHGSKLEIKSSARTVREEVTEDLWQKHLDGTSPLGIIPIDGNDSCVWGCIDIDRYDISHAELANQIKSRHLPVIVCKTKSGGAHVFMFVYKAIPASEMQSRLRNLAASLGYGGSEIFPKQGRMLLDRGDLGNWLNMPYFGGSERWGIKHTGSAMSAEEFLATAERLAKEADGYVQPNGADHDLVEGPPCLQHLSVAGFPEGTRNNGLFALGVFARKKYQDGWKEILEEYNRRFMKPPLDTSEVQMVIKSLEKREYSYRCDDVPLCTHCDAATCRTRRFGVGDPESFPIISGLSVLDTTPPLWFIDIEGTRVELNTEQLQNYKLFHRMCMERLLTCYRMLSQPAWLKIIGEAMKNVTKVEAPPEVGISGQFFELLEDFCLNRQRGQSKDDILSGRPFEESGRHYFRLRDLAEYLDRAGMKSLTRAQLSMQLRVLGGGHTFFNVKGKGVNVWWVPGGAMMAIPRLDPPVLAEDPI